MQLLKFQTFSSFVCTLHTISSLASALLFFIHSCFFAFEILVLNISKLTRSLRFKQCLMRATEYYLSKHLKNGRKKVIESKEQSDTFGWFNSRLRGCREAHETMATQRGERTTCHSAVLLLILLIVFIVSMETSN